MALAPRSVFQMLDKQFPIVLRREWLLKRVWPLPETDDTHDEWRRLNEPEAK
jgi:hypothetical protein